MGCDHPGEPIPCTCEECEDCNDCQTYCETKGQTIKEICEESDDFSFSVVPAKDVIIAPEKGYFNQDVWNQIIEWINKGRELETIEGKNSHNGGSEISKANYPANAPFYAEEFNRVAKVIHQTTDDIVNSNDIIYASLFTSLVYYANSKNLVSAEACKQCNSECDVCDSCQQCNECEGCNTCQDCDSCNDCTDCEITCESCDGCEGCESDCEAGEGCIAGVI